MSGNNNRERAERHTIGECCECKWYDPLNTFLGECRRYPPGGERAYLNDNLAVQWPVVRTTSWCGEWLEYIDEDVRVPSPPRRDAAV